MNKNIIVLGLLFFLNTASASASEIISIAIGDDNNVGIATEEPETTFHVIGDTTLEGTTYLQATYSTCVAIANDPAKDCDVQDMCGISYFSGANKSDLECNLTYLTTYVSTGGSYTNWSLSAAVQDCEATCVSFR